MKNEYKYLTLVISYTKITGYIQNFLMYSTLRYGFSVLLFLWSTTSKAQEINSGDFIGTKIHVGKIINNYTSFDSFPKTTPTAIIEFSLGQQTTGNKQWQQHYGFPQVGVSIVGGYLGDSKQFGFFSGVYPYVILNTLKSEKWSMSFKMGLGMAYFNKPYDSLSNPNNILIGSHVTALGFAEIYFKRELTKRLFFEFGTSVFHASNGHTGLPNVGMNIISLSSGLKYYLTQPPTTFERSNKSNMPRSVSYFLRIGVGAHRLGNELGPVNSPLYPVYDAAFYAKKPAGKLGSAIVGIGYKYYTSYYEGIIKSNVYTKNQHAKASVITLFLAYEFEMGQMSLLVQGGINVYHPFWKDYVAVIEDEYTFYKAIEGLVSTRFGLQYYFLDKEKFDQNIFLSLYVKANMGGADFAGTAIGIKF